MTKVSSTYLNHSSGLSWASERARFSKFSMNISAMMGEMGDPIAAQETCS